MVVWKSKSQRSVALSSSEAEYISILEITKGILFVKQVLELSGQEIDFPINMMVDNIGAIYMAENNMSNNQTKHVNTKYHFVRELIKDGKVKVEFERSEIYDSDIFSKNLGGELFKKHNNKFMSMEYDEQVTDIARRTTRDGQRETDNARRTSRDGQRETDNPEKESGIQSNWNIGDYEAEGEREGKGTFG
jgi:hypothetical protein